MNDSIIIIMGAVVMVGYIAFRFYFDKPSDSARQSTKPRPSSSKPSSSLYQARKDDHNPIHSNEVTLIANSRFARDEILGTVDLIDGHHTIPPEYTKSDVIRTWTYVGDHNMPFNTEFKKEIQSILSNMKSQNWSAESVPNDGKKEIWLLTR